MYCRKTFENLLELNSPVKPFSFRYDGEPFDLSGVSCTIKTGKDGKVKRIYEVIPNLLRLTLDMNVFKDFPVIEYTPYFENIGDRDSGILSDISVLDLETEDETMFLEKNGKINPDWAPGSSRLRIRYNMGCTGSGVDFLPQTRDLFSRPGCCRLELESLASRCSTDYLPFFGIDSDPMNGINLALGWNCAWKFTAEKEVRSKVWGTGRKSRIRCGMKYASFRLHPGEKVMQPGILLYFREGKSIRDGQNEFRRFMVAHNSPRNSRDELIKPPMSLSFWGGLESDKQIQRIRLARKHALPYETVWIDAGWMGSPGPCPHFLENSTAASDWPRRVGSWKFNTWAHPKGLKPIAEEAHEAGMRLMVWFESLRIFSASGAPVIREHPEWLLGDKKAFAEGKEVSFLLNIGIPEARKYILNIVCGIMEKEGIDDYREDFNVEDPGVFFASNDEADRIGITEMKFVEGLYLFWGEIRKRYPDRMIDNCGSGGRRLDYKTAALSFPLCQSDFGAFPSYEVDYIHFENQFLDDWMPLHGTLNWGEDDPYHAAGGMGGGYASKIWQFNGREPRPDHDYDLHRTLLKWGKQLRDIHLTGDVYPLVESPELDRTKWNGQQIHDPARNCGMVQIFRRKHSPEADFQLKLSGLEPEAVYEAEFFSGEKKTLSGRELASLNIHLDSPRSFQIIRYRKQGDI